MSGVPPSFTPDESANTKSRWPVKAIVSICAVLMLASGVGIATVVFLSGPTRPAINDDPLSTKFVHLPKGTFYMGGRDGKPGNKTEIKEDFEIAIYTVTQGQWQALMGDNPSTFRPGGRNAENVKKISDEALKQFPVESVSWNDVQDFIKRLNAREKNSGWLYRLPWEAEWEYACPGGATSEEECSYNFYFDKPSNDVSLRQANFNGIFLAGDPEKWPFLKRTTMVGSYKPNKLGLYDMHGNVRQWCEDLRKGGPDRVTRGGSWDEFGEWSTAGWCSRCAPSYHVDTVGFRLVRVSSGK
jgi:formylglycine-generating enzyme required for sulfatase activity